MDSAIIFSFNILRNVYSRFGLAHFKPVQAILKEEFDKIELLPIINFEETTIERRAKAINEELPKLLDKMKCKQAHIISYSLSGLDYRYFISQMNGDQYIKSLTTLSSPHLGSFLAYSVNRKLIKDYHVEGLSRLLGVGLHSFKEFDKENIESFNLVCANSNKTKYFSIGSSKGVNLCSEMLRNSAKYISENRVKLFISDNDGAFSIEEVKWGKHLFNYPCDHAEIVGLGYDKTSEWEKIYRFCVDHIKYEDHEEHPLKYRNAQFA